MQKRAALRLSCCWLQSASDVALFYPLSFAKEHTMTDSDICRMRSWDSLGRSLDSLGATLSASIDGLINMGSGWGNNQAPYQGGHEFGQNIYDRMPDFIGHGGIGTY
jgi:hypothetical protein